MADDSDAAKLFVLQEWGNARETVLEELALTRVERDTYRDNAETMNEAAARHLRRAEHAEKRLDTRVTELLEANNRMLQRARDAADLITELVAALDEAVGLRVKLYRNSDPEGDTDNLSDAQVAKLDRFASKWSAALVRARSKGE